MKTAILLSVENLLSKLSGVMNFSAPQKATLVISRAKRSILPMAMLLGMMLGFIQQGFSVEANIWNGNGGPDWNTASSWSLSRVPLSTDVVLIPENSSVTISTTAQCNNLTINAGATLTNNGTLTIGNTLSGAGTLTNEMNAILNISGDASITTLIANAVGNTVNYDGSGAQAVKGTTYANLTILGSGTKTLGGNTDVGGVLTVKAGTTLDLVANSLGAAIPSPSVVLECGASTGSVITGNGILYLGYNFYYNVTVNNVTSGTGGATISCPLVMDETTGSIAFNVANDGTSETDLTVSGVISTNRQVGKAGEGTLMLSGLNTYTNLTNILEGTIKLGSAGNGTNSPLGIAAEGTWVLGGVLDLNGYTLSTNEALYLTGTGISNGGALINSSTNPVSYGGYINLASPSSIGTTGNITKVTLAIRDYTSTPRLLTKVGVGKLVLNCATSTKGGINITEGTVELEDKDLINDVEPIILNGGTFSTSESTGFDETVSTLALTENSAILLGTGVHSLHFSACNGVSWTADKTLTIKGWTGIAGSTGTEGKIYFGAAAGTLTATQLSQITFEGYTGTPVLLSTGELIPNIVTPVITVGSISGFGNQCINTNSGIQSYLVSGTSLIGPIVIAPPSGFEISDTGGESFESSNTLSFLSSDGTGTISNIPIYVRFAPTAAQVYSGDITHTSTGATSVNVAVSGMGISAPVSDFTGSPTSVDAGGSVTFTDNSTNTPTSWSWSFTGGSPSTSTNQNPVITYSTPGLYNVSLTATNGCGSDTEIKTDYIFVSSSCMDATIELSSAAGTDAQTICGNSAITSIIYNIGGEATDASAEGLPDGVTGNFSGGTFTISGTPNVSGIFSYSVTTSGTAAPCTEATANGTIAVNVNPTAEEPALGDGSPGDPYQIASLQNLYWITATNAEVASPTQTVRFAAHYIQTSNINASETKLWCTGGWVPIGTYYINFTGNYNGNGKTISELYIPDSPDFDDFGLFGYASGATFQNIGLLNVNINGVEGWAGGLVGSTESVTINNCYSTGNIVAHISGDYETGGLVGYFSVNSAMSDCYSACNVSGAMVVGGLVGFNNKSTISNSHYNNGTIVSLSAEETYCGGLVGLNSGSISKCYSTGTVNGFFYTGGLVGKNDWGGQISNSFSRCFCSNDPDWGSYGGGLVGANWFTATITNCYSPGRVTSTLMGGLVGLGYESAFNSFWNTDVAESGTDWSDGGTGTNTTALKTQSTFTGAGWDFTTIWGINAGINDGYPFFLPESDCTNGTLTLNSASGTDNQTICANSAIIPIVYTVGGGASGATISPTLPDGLSETYDSDLKTFTISGTPTFAVTYDYTATTIGTASPCTEANATGTITISASPNAGQIDGTGAICVSYGTYLTTDGDPDGSWSSLNPDIASISETGGEVQGVSAGTATIYYTVTGSGVCEGKQDISSLELTVSAPPDAGIIKGSDEMCIGETATLKVEGEPGGVWASNMESIVQVDQSGTLSALQTGTATITYIVDGAGGCDEENDVAELEVTVKPLPEAGTIQGDAQICIGNYTVLTSDGDADGTWSSSNENIASVNQAGLVDGWGSGVATITYTVSGTGGCIGKEDFTTFEITVSSPPDAGIISGNNIVCVGSSTQLTSNGDAMGRWNTTDAGVALVHDGLVTGMAAGTATITYNVFGSGACSGVSNYSTLDITVTAPEAGEISGNNIIYKGITSQLSVTGNSTTGTWASMNTDIATVNTTGLVTGVSFGTATITYTVEGNAECEGKTGVAEYQVTVGVYTSQIFTSSVEFTVPAGVYSIDAKAWGGGGGGGEKSPAYAGCGGGGGGFRGGTLIVSPGNLITITVGIGGTGALTGTLHPDYGENGASSVVSHSSGTITASGGIGGGPTYGSNAYGGEGTFTGTVTNQSGFRGGDGRAQGGGGGGGAGDKGNGGNGSLPAGGTGGWEGGGIGGNGSTDASSGGDGSVCGGGGGGSSTNNLSRGGNGAAGKVIISWISISCTDPTLALSTAVGTDAQSVCKGSPVTNITYTVGGGASGAEVAGLPTGVTGEFAGGIFTISGTPTIAGNFNYTVTTTGTTAPCTEKTAMRTITVNELPDASFATIASNTPICETDNAEFYMTGTANAVVSYSISDIYGTTNKTVTLDPVGHATVVISGVAKKQTMVLNSVQNPATGCTTSLSAYAVIEVKPLPFATFDIQASNSPVCFGENAHFYIIATPGSILLYNIEDSEAFEWATIDASGKLEVIFPSVTSNITVQLISVEFPGGLCQVGLDGSSTVIVNPLPEVSITESTTVPVGETTSLSPSSGGTWTSSNDAVAAVTDAGLVTGITLGTANFTFTDETTGCSATTDLITVTPELCTGYAVAVQGISGNVVSASNATGAFDGNVASLGNGAGLILDLTGNSINIGTIINLKLYRSDDGVSQVIQVYGSSDGSTWTSIYDGGILIWFTDPMVYPLPVTENTRYLKIVNASQPIWLYIDGVSYKYVCTDCSDGTLTLTTGNQIQSVCQNDAISTISYTAGGGASEAEVTGLPSGVNGELISGILTISGTPTVVGVYDYTVTTSGSSPCPEANASGTITVKILPVVSITGETTIFAGETTELIPASGGTWTSSNEDVAIVSNTGVVTGVSAGTPTFTFTDATTGCIATTEPIIVYPEACNGYAIAVQGISGNVVSASNAIGAFDGAVASLGNGAGLILDLTGCNITMGTIINLKLYRSDDGVSQVIQVYRSSDGSTWTSIYDGGILIWFTDPMVYPLPVTEDTRYLKIVNASKPIWLYIDGVSYKYVCTDCSDGILTLTTGNHIQSVCQNAVISTISYTVGGGASGAEVTGLPTGVSGEFAGGTFIISGTPTEVGIFNYKVSTTGTAAPCPEAKASGTITVEPLPIVSITGETTIFVGETTTLSPATGGTWTSSNEDVATVTDGGLVTGIAPGTASFTYTNTTTGCSATTTGITVLNDSELPTAICQDVIVYLDDAGKASTTAQLVDNGSWDESGIKSLELSKTDFTCADIATNPNVVTLTVTDNYGNESTCQADVTVVDNVSPVAVCKNIDVNLDETGIVLMDGDVVADIDGGSSDACGIAKREIDIEFLTCENVGPNLVYLTVTDVNGLTNTCEATITVHDVTPPEAVCENIEVKLDATGNASIIADELDGGSSDACGIAKREINVDAFTCDNIGPNTVTFTITDRNGLTGTCQATVTVVDNTPPSITTPASNETVECDGFGNTEDYNEWLQTHAGAVASEACGEVTWSYEEGVEEGEEDAWIYDCASGKAKHITVTFHATDASNNKSVGTTAVFEIKDTTPPTIAIEAVNLTVSCTPWAYVTRNKWLSFHGSAEATDGCSNVTWHNDFNEERMSDGCGNTGSEIVTFTAVDACGNSITTQATFTIEDNTPPYVETPVTNLSTVDCAGSAAAPTILPVINDLCSGTALSPIDDSPDPVYLVWSDIVEDFVPVNAEDFCEGLVEYTFNYTDECENPFAWTYTYTVDIPAFADITPTEASVECNGDFNPDLFEPPTVYDYCGKLITNITRLTEEVQLKGAIIDICAADVIYTWTYTDCAGNSKNYVHTVHIVKTDFADNMPDDDGTVVECADKIAGLVPTPPQVYDNCGTEITPTGPVVSQTPDCEGEVTYKWTYTDCTTNFSHIWTYTFKIDRTTAPYEVGVPVANSAIVECFNMASAPANLPVAKDVCGNILEPVGDIAVGSSVDGCEGTKTFTYTYFDCANLPFTWTFTYTVDDTQDPTANVLAPINVQCFSDIPAANIEDVKGEADNCGGTPVVAWIGDYTPKNGGCDGYEHTITRTYSVTDCAGNSIEVYQTINVKDVTPPTITSKAATVLLDAGGSASIELYDVLEEASDNCLGDLIIDFEPKTFTCENVGAKAVTVTAVDCVGNKSSCTAVVTVQDLVQPAITCVPNTSMYVDPYQTYYTVLGTEFNATANDACGNPTPTYVLSGATSGSGTSLAGVKLNVGTNTIVWTAVDVNNNSSTCTTVVTVAKRTTSLTYNGDLTEQYSDVTNLSATLFDISGGLPGVGVNGKTITFTIGTQTATGITDANGKATATLIITQAHGSYSVISTFVADDSYLGNVDNDDFNITEEGACVNLIGQVYFNTSGTTVNTANLTFTWAVSQDDDGNAGDLNSSTIQMVIPTIIADGGKATVIGTPVFNSANSTFTANVNVEITNNSAGSAMNFTLHWDVTGGYFVNKCDQDAVITVAIPGNDFAAGGGYIILTDKNSTLPSVVTKTGTVGSKNHFGFNVKWAKNFSKPTGSFNTIWRQGSAVWQAKSNSAGALIVTKISTDPANPRYKAQITYTNVNVRQLGCEVCAPAMGGSTVIMTVYDWSEQGVAGTKPDQIGFVVKDNKGKLIYSTNYYSATQKPDPTIVQNLAAGNVQVKSSTVRTVDLANVLPEAQVITPVTGKLNVYPNPSYGPINFKFTLEESGKATLDIFTITGQPVDRIFEGYVERGIEQTVLLNKPLPEGMYIYRLTYGNHMRTGKIINTVTDR